MKSSFAEREIEKFVKPFIEIFGPPDEMVGFLYSWRFGQFYFYIDVDDYLKFQKFWVRSHDTMYLELELTDVLTEIDSDVADKIIFNLDRFR